jgi:hypothetical protein
VTADSSRSLSIVVTGRNDNYGGDFNERFFAALRFNHARLSERGVRCEVIFVEWNPVANRPYLAELLRRECRDIACCVHCFVVAPAYHAALTQNPAVRYLEFVAKNIGLRRASAPLVLATNTDVFLGRNVVDAIASGDLARHTIYRAPRYDIKLSADPTRITWETLEDGSNHVYQPVLRPPLFQGGTGDFVLADRTTLHELGGFNEVCRFANLLIDLNFLVKAHGAGVPIVDIGGPVYHFNHVGSFRISQSLSGASSPQPTWGRKWHGRHVVYANPEGWGLRDAPVRPLGDGITYLDFDWRAVPPLVELRRIRLPMRQGSAATA